MPWPTRVPNDKNPKKKGLCSSSNHTWQNNIIELSAKAAPAPATKNPKKTGPIEYGKQNFKQDANNKQKLNSTALYFSPIFWIISELNNEKKTADMSWKVLVQITAWLE